MAGAVAGLLQHPHARVVRLPLDLAQHVLEQERYASERAIGQPGAGLLANAFETAQDHRVELRVKPLDARDRGVDQLGGRNLPAAHQFRLCRRVQPEQVIHRCHYTRRPANRRSVAAPEVRLVRTGQ